MATEEPQYSLVMSSHFSPPLAPQKSARRNFSSSFPVLEKKFLSIVRDQGKPLKIEFLNNIQKNCFFFLKEIDPQNYSSMFQRSHCGYMTSAVIFLTKRFTFSKDTTTAFTILISLVGTPIIEKGFDMFFSFLKNLFYSTCTVLAKSPNLLENEWITCW